MAPADKNERKDPVTDFMNTMDRLFSDKPVKGMLQSMNDFFSSATIERGFAVDVEESETEYYVQASLPGIGKNLISIEFIAGALVISVKNDEIQTEENKAQNSFRKKHIFRSTTKTIPFAKPVDEKGITANHRDGLLEITVPKLKGKQVKISE